MNSIKKFTELLSDKELKNAWFLLFMVVIMAFLDVVGVASIMPFIAVLNNPGLIESSSVLNFFYYNMNFENQSDFLFTFGLLVFVLLVFSLLFKALTVYMQTRFSLMLEYSIGRRLVEGYLQQPYSWFLNRHSSDLGKTILSEVANLINGGILPLMTFVAQSAVALGLILMLLIVDPQLAISVRAELMFMAMMKTSPHTNRHHLIPNNDSHDV